MPDAKKPYYITTAIAYPNGAPHIGHVYEAIATDAIARFHALDGRDVRFLTGTDEHGLKMSQTAAREGVKPFDWATTNAARFKAMDERYGISFDRFIRTTDKDHYAASQELWRRMAASGDVYLGKYEGWYSVRDEAYFDESETTVGEGGKRFAPSGAPVEWVVEESYFFRLSAYQDRLLKLYEDEPGFIGPDARRNEVLAFVNRGLQDLSISRTTFDWGVPVPGDPKHVMYVWVDALTNYITGAGFPDEASELWRYWPADLHVIGKDIIRFHTVFWPAFLMSAGIPLPKRVFAHGFLYNRGEKMSKSVGNVVDPFALADGYGVDAVRYFLLREVPFGQDGSYSHDAIVGRLNADLANDLGNLAQRSLSMIGKNCDGEVPTPGAFTDADAALLASVDALLGKTRSAFDDLALHTVLSTIWAVVADANRYFASQEPWALKKTDPERMATVLYVTAETVRQVAILAQPFVPESASRLLGLLGVPDDRRDFAALGQGGRLAPGAALPAPQPVFPRFVEPPTEAAQ
ncbi:methionine--tRNA ligase [Methylopila sp. M107]|uniref:methionine--tRNA ligase n=1 Tax=Methylopila sp. M107 TaxID=1101190 RepID=UPI00035DF2F4|nr:methionine--tRNA ligase [Methylopila sp. M107]